MADFDVVAREFFGTALRLRVAFAVLDWGPGSFYQQQIADLVEYRSDYVGRELRKLERLGLVEPSLHGGGKNRYRRTRSRLWEVLSKLKDVLGDEA